MSTRRDFLKSGALGSLALGCDGVVDTVARQFEGSTFESFSPPMSKGIDAAHHLLSRAAFGPTPGEVDEVRALGEAQWVERQLQPEGVDDPGAWLRTAFIDAAHWPPDLAFELRPEAIEKQLITYTLLRAVYSRRQLHEVMVMFFRDHFNIAIGKSLCKHLKPTDEREVIRKHALGRFPELLKASALSPAMLVYLDGRNNQRTKPDEQPNENYARELLELHALGVKGGYTQRDVMEAARCLTGWVVREGRTPGKVEFVSSRHDDGEKIVLGKRIGSGGGPADVDRLIDIVVQHPSCSKFVAGKLCRWFVSDESPAALVRRAADAFRAHGGDLKPVVRTVLTSEEFRAARGQKLKRPFRFVVSALRALGAQTHGRGPFGSSLVQMGQGLFQFPTPDGYPIHSRHWTAGLLGRFRFARSLTANEIPGTKINAAALARAVTGPHPKVALVLGHLFGRAPTAKELSTIRAYANEVNPDVVALALASPAFQRH